MTLEQAAVTLEQVGWIDPDGDLHNYGHGVETPDSVAYTHVDADKCEPVYRVVT